MALRKTNYPRRKELRTKYDIVKQAFDIIKDRKLSLTSVETTCGFSHGYLGKINQGYAPVLPKLIKLLDTLGYELKIVPKEKNGNIAKCGNGMLQSSEITE